MKSLFILAGILFIALFAGMTNARKDTWEYWQGVKKDEFIRDVNKVTSIPTKENNCHTSSTGSRDFEPRPNISAYNKPKEDKSFGKEYFEPIPNVSSYNDVVVKYFEPRPNVSAYNEDGKEGKMAVESQPNV
ncbi:hypothetical protein ACS0TY_003729 [Phlomoides rotata]